MAKHGGFCAGKIDNQTSRGLRPIALHRFWFRVCAACQRDPIRTWVKKVPDIGLNAMPGRRVGDSTYWLQMRSSNEPTFSRKKNRLSCSRALPRLTKVPNARFSLNGSSSCDTPGGTLHVTDFILLGSGIDIRRAYEPEHQPNHRNSCWSHGGLF